MLLDTLDGFRLLLSLGLLILALGVKVWALVDAIRHRTDAYPAAGKRTKTLWVAILSVAAAVQVITLNPLNFLDLIGVAAAIIYLVDVRPALQQVEGGRGGRGSQMGPYGPW